MLLNKSTPDLNRFSTPDLLMVREKFVSMQKQIVHVMERPFSEWKWKEQCVEHIHCTPSKGYVSMMQYVSWEVRLNLDSLQTKLYQGSGLPLDCMHDLHYPGDSGRSWGPSMADKLSHTWHWVPHFSDLGSHGD